MYCMYVHAIRPPPQAIDSQVPRSLKQNAVTDETKKKKKTMMKAYNSKLERFWTMPRLTNYATGYQANLT